MININKHKLLIAFLLLVLSVMLPTSALADQDDFSDKTTQDCTERKTGIEKRTPNLQKQIDNMITQYERRRDRFVAIADSIENGGGNADKLRTDIEELNSKIDKLRSDTDEFMNKLNTAQEFSCDDPAAYFNALDEAFNHWNTTVKEDKKDINLYIAKYLLADLREVRKLNADNKKCANKVRQVDAAIRNTEKRRDNSLNIYQKRRDNLYKRIIELEENGADMSQSREDMAQYDIMIDDLRADYDVLLTKMGEAKQNICENPRSLQEARSGWKEVNSNFSVINKHVGRVVNPGIAKSKKELNSK